jgi:hypothetical protein
MSTALFDRELDVVLLAEFLYVILETTTARSPHLQTRAKVFGLLQENVHGEITAWVSVTSAECLSALSMCGDSLVAVPQSVRLPKDERDMEPLGVERNLVGYAVQFIILG